MYRLSNGMFVLYQAAAAAATCVRVHFHPAIKDAPGNSTVLVTDLVSDKTATTSIHVRENAGH